MGSSWIMWVMAPSRSRRFNAALVLFVKIDRGSRAGSAGRGASLGEQRRALITSYT